MSCLTFNFTARARYGTFETQKPKNYMPLLVIVLFFRFVALKTQFFSWRTIEKGACSVSCGNGTLQRTIRCVEEKYNGDIVRIHEDESECGNLVKPESVEACNTFQCPKWIVGNWSDVS